MLYVPGGQFSLPPEPCDEGLVLPVYRELPAAAGGPGQKVPVSHNVQLAWPAVLYLPAGQYMQPGAPPGL